MSIKSIVIFSLLGSLIGLQTACEDEESYSVPESQKLFCDETCQARAGFDCFSGVTVEQYKQFCEEGCLARYKNFPDCEQELIALDNCEQKEITYSCDSNTLVFSPKDACGEVNYTCVACTGKSTGCAM